MPPTTKITRPTRKAIDPTKAITLQVPRSDLPAGYDKSATCPKCEAKPGADCTTPSGRPLRGGGDVVHRERIAKVAALSRNAMIRSASRRIKTGQG